MPKQQVNIKLPPTLVETLRARATTEETTLTDLIQGFCEKGLGLPHSNDSTPDLELVYKRILSEVDKRILSKVDERIPNQLVTPLAVFQAQTRQEMQQQIDFYISKQLADAYKQISELILRTRADIELRIREAIRQVVTAPETRETQSDVEAIEVSDEPLPTLEAVAVVAESEQELITDAATDKTDTATDRIEHFKIEHLPVETVHTVSSSNDGWLTVKDAYALAQQRGYTKDKNGFRMLSESGFRKLGFEVVRSRTEKGARNSRWLRSIPDWSTEDAQ